MESRIRLSIRLNESLEQNVREKAKEYDEDLSAKHAENDLLVFERCGLDELTNDSLSLKESGLRQRRNLKSEQKRPHQEFPGMSSKSRDEYQTTPITALPSTEMREAIKSFSSAVDQVLQLASINRRVSIQIDRLGSNDTSG